MSSDNPFDRTGPDPASRNTHSLSTDRLRIELGEPADAAVLYRLIGGADRDEVAAGLLWDGPDDIAEVESWIDKGKTEHYAEWGFHWVVRDATGEFTGTPGEAMGAIGVRPVGVPGRGDVGYWLGRSYWGQGIMTEALGALLRFGFDQLGYAKMEAEVFLTNPRGIALVETVGMSREGMIRRCHRKRGQWVDAAYYGILPEELPNTG